MEVSDIKSSIVIADSQFLIVEALKSLLGGKYFIRNTVNCKSDLQAILKSDLPKILIIDHLLLDFEGINDLKVIKDSFPELTIIILTNNITRNELKELISLGINNILHKNANHEELFSCLKDAERGKKCFSDIFLDLIIEPDEKRGFSGEFNQLTASETEIVRLIAQGLTTKEIAAQKFISFHTVMTHRRNILRKLGVSNASELIMYAISSGIINTIEYNI
jgi:Response regulator containing a CheY-like receiver domain and an HTH DNA-binding domain